MKKKTKIIKEIVDYEVKAMKCLQEQLANCKTENRRKKIERRLNKYNGYWGI